MDFLSAVARHSSTLSAGCRLSDRSNSLIAGEVSGQRSDGGELEEVYKGDVAG
jgi:hypothetical protein